MKLEDIYRLQRFMKTIRDVRPSMRMGQILTLLEVAINDGVTQKDLMKRFGFSKTSASRYVAAMGKIGVDGVPGMDMARVEQDEEDNRVKIIYPTENLKQLAERLSNAWNK